MNSSDKPRVLISAGELSGDESAALVAASLKSLAPGIEISAMGGRNLRSVGARIIVDCEKSGSVMGFFDVFASLSKIRNAMQAMRSCIDTWQPHLLVIVDFPDFNLRLARYARSKGIPVLCFIPPKVWAWRSGRIKQLRALCSHIALIFPFEESYYKKHGVNQATFVGHPMSASLDRTPLTLCTRSAGRERLTLHGEHPTLGLFPGSRKFEIARNLPPMIEAFQIARRSEPKLQAIVSRASSIDIALINQHIPSGLPISVSDAPATELLKLCDSAVMKSGTSNLQAAFCGVPFCMYYRISRSSDIFLRPFVHVREFSPVNVVRSGSTREIVEVKPASDQVAVEILKLLFDVDYREQIKRNLAEVAQLLSPPAGLKLQQLIDARGMRAEIGFADGDTPALMVAKIALGLIRAREPWLD